MKPIYTIYLARGFQSKVFSYYRCVLPVRHLASRLADCGIALDQGFVSTKELPQADCFVFDNCISPEFFATVEMIKRQAQVIWHIDDNFWQIAASNPSKDRITSLHCKLLEECLQLADLIFVTTPQLKDVVTKLGNRPTKIIVVPNLVDLDDYPVYCPKVGKRTLWAGSYTHHDDLELIGNLPGKLPDWEFVFLSQLPPQVAGFGVKPGRIKVEVSPIGKNVGFVPAVPFESYQPTFIQLANGSSVGICPLAPTIFNQSKSHLKYAEMGAMGLPVVASNTGPYADVIVDGVNGFLADTEQDWIDRLSKCSPELGRAAYEYVKYNLSWQSEAAVSVWEKALTYAAFRPVPVSITWGD